MKHLHLFEEYNSGELIDGLKDILLTLTDNVLFYYRIEEEGNHLGILIYKHGKHGYGSSSFIYSEISDIINHVYSYLVENGCHFDFIDIFGRNRKSFNSLDDISGDMETHNTCIYFLLN